MRKSEFLQYVKSIKPDKHIIAGRRGSEENIKIKFLLPLLQFLGYDILEDVDFELMSADAVLLDGSLKPLLIIETKAWEQSLDNYFNQCLEYTFKLRTPLIMISSGQQTAIYSPLTGDFGKAKNLFEFSFRDLLSNRAEVILDQLYKLISKESLESGGKEVNNKILELAGGNKNLKELKKEFIGKCKGFKPVIKTVKITDDRYVEIANTHNKNIRNALILGKEEFQKIAQGNSNVNLRYRSKEIGLEYIDKSGLRQKILGLVGLYPERAMIAFGTEHWIKLLSSKDIIKKIQDFSRDIRNEQQIRDLIQLIKNGLNDILKNSKN